MDLSISIIIIFFSSILLQYYIMYSIPFDSSKYYFHSKFRIYQTLVIFFFFSFIITLLFDIFTSSFSITYLTLFIFLFICSFYLYRKLFLFNEHDFLKYIVTNNSYNIHAINVYSNKIKDERIKRLTKYILKTQNAQRSIIHTILKQHELQNDSSAK